MDSPTRKTREIIKSLRQRALSGSWRNVYFWNIVGAEILDHTASTHRKRSEKWKPFFRNSRCRKVLNLHPLPLRVKLGRFLVNRRDIFNAEWHFNKLFHRRVTNQKKRIVSLFIQDLKAVPTKSHYFFNEINDKPKKLFFSAHKRHLKPYMGNNI